MVFSKKQIAKHLRGDGVLRGAIILKSIKLKVSFKLFTTTMLLMVSIVTYGQGLNEGSTDKNYYTEINYEYVKGKIIIPVVIEDKTYRFILDTGAPNIISSALKKRIKTNYQKSISVKDANNKEKSMDIVTIPLITVGGVSFYNTPSLVNESGANLFFDCFKIDGFIGSNMLRNSIIQILPEKQLIRITRDKKRLSLIKKNATKLSLVGDQRQPFIWLKIKGYKKANERVLIDTGMGDFYALSNEHLRILQKDSIIKIANEGVGSMGSGLFGVEEKSKYYRVTIPEIEIINSAFKNVLVETTNSKNSRIGTEMLAHGNVTIDFKNKRFYYDAFKTIIDLEKKSYGFSPAIIDNKLAVGIVWHKDLKKELNYGEQIIKINGIDYSEIEVCDLITQRSRFKDNVNLELVILDKHGEEKTILLKKELLK